MGSDIFESYCGAMIASIAIASTLDDSGRMLLPLALASIGLIASVLGIAIVKAFSSLSPDAALRTGTIGSAILFIIAAYFLIQILIGESFINVWLAVLTGAVGGVLIGLITEYYTGSRPIRDIAKSGETGPATVMITGLAVGMQSVVLPILVLALSLIHI